MKKFFCLMLVSILSLVLFVGCGKEDDTPVTVKVEFGFSGNDGDEVDGVKTFSSPKGAIDYFASANLGDVQKIVKFSAGTFEQKLLIPKEVTNLRFIGSESGETKLTFMDYASMYDDADVKDRTEKAWAVKVSGNGFMAKNITFENSFNYINPPKGASDLQGLAIYVDADKCVFEKCTFLGVQDTLESAFGRHYYKDCTIKGAVDYIFGINATAVFENCDVININRNKKGGYIAVTKGNNGGKGIEVPKFGFVFNGCRLTAEGSIAQGTICLGRPWGQDATVAYLNCEMGAHIGKSAFGRGTDARYTNMTEYDHVNYPHAVNYYEYNNTGDGATQEILLPKISRRENYQTIIEEPDVPDFKHLTAEQAGEYTLTNIFAKTNGGVTYDADWDAAASLTALQNIN